MKYTKHIQELIIDLATEGLSSRMIAHELGISKSGVNDFLAEFRGPPKDKPKILVFDLETAATLAYCFGRYNINLSQDNIHKEGGWLLCGSATWFDGGTVFNGWLSPKEIKKGEDYNLVKNFRDMYEQADAVVAHNGASFDHKVLEARCLANGLPPLPKVKVLDTKLIAKKHLRLPSNSLDSIAAYFNLGRKISTGGISLWARVQEGDPEAMKEMVQYCENDTLLLESVYSKLRHLDTTFNQALYYPDDEVRCAACGSTNVAPTGRTVKTTVSVFEEVKCNDCGAVHRTRQNILDSYKRKSLLSK